MSEATDVVVNGGAGLETSLLELCGQLSAAAGHPDVQPVFEPPRKVNPVSRRLANTRMAEERIGFRATTSLADGLRRLVEWHSAIPELVGAAR